MQNKPEQIDLTDRELDVLRLLARGYSNQEIADELVFTVGTVKWYNRQIYNKLNVSNRTEAVAMAHKHDLLTNKRRPHSSPMRSLPKPLTSLVGRQQEINHLSQMLQSKKRLITLTGPPGVGKTRLALETAHVLLDVYLDGVFFVTLAQIQHAELVPDTIAQIFKTTDLDMISPFDTLIDYIEEKDILLVLDNFEHLLSGAHWVTQMLKAAPNLSVLVTSREPLQVYGEYEYSVPPLQLPDLKESHTIDSFQSFEAVDLLIQRSQMVNSDFAFNADNARAIAMICVHLDGLPLAIELAAARMRHYAPQTLLMRLGSRLTALNDGPRDFPDRQRTLRATLEWSYELLNRDERHLFNRLGIFVGGCTFEAIDTICSHDLKMPLIKNLESLFMKSLIQKEDHSPSIPRFWMLETMKEFALEKIREEDEYDELCNRYVNYFRTIVNQGYENFYSPNETAWLERLEVEHDNLRAVLEWSLSNDDTGQKSLEMIAHLARFWEKRGYFSEARSWLKKVLAIPNMQVGTKAHAEALYGISLLTYLQGDNSTARDMIEEALKIYEKLHDHRRASYSLTRLGEIVSSMGDTEAALSFSQAAYERAIQVGNKNAQANALCQLGFENMRLGQYEIAYPFLLDSLALYNECNDTDGSALAYAGLGELLIRKGDYKIARDYLYKSQNIRENLGDKWGITVIQGSLAWIEVEQKNFQVAKDLLRHSMLGRYYISEMGGFSWCLEKLAEISLFEEDASQAVRLLAAASAIRQRINSNNSLYDQLEYQKLIDRIKQKLDDDLYEVLWSEGYKMSLDSIFRLVDITHPHSLK